MARKDIIQELNELGSTLADNPSQNIYSVPEGYFEAFASTVLSRIVEEESPFLAQLPKTNPYQVPYGYFDRLTESILEKIRNHPDYLNTQEELESISPLLSSLSKEPVYSVPKDYFRNFTVEVNHKQPAKVVGLFSRKLMRYAAAAVITAAIATAGLIIFTNNRKTDVENIMAKVEKDVKKIDDAKQLESLVDFMDAGLNEKEVAVNGKKSSDVEKLLNDVSIDELKEFSDESKDIQDVMMTN